MLRFWILWWPKVGFLVHQIIYTIKFMVFYSEFWWPDDLFFWFDNNPNQTTNTYMGREALCAQCLLVWNICTYIYIFYIFTPFLLVIKPLSYWEQELRDNYLCGFFLRKNTFGKYSVIVIIWGICARLFSLNVTWRCRGHQLWKTFHESVYFLEQTEVFLGAKT